VAETFEYRQEFSFNVIRYKTLPTNYDSQIKHYPQGILINKIINYVFNYLVPGNDMDMRTATLTGISGVVFT
jgi:hypothetical protein